MFDTDANGYFDRWEYDFGTWRRIAAVQDEKTEDIAWDYEAVSERYTRHILPEAMDATTQFMAAMAATHPFVPPSEFKEALGSGPANFRRYAQDILCELHYADFFTYWSRIANDILAVQPMDDLRRLDSRNRASQPTSQTAWDLERLLSRIDHLYGQGELGTARELIETSPNIFQTMKGK